MSTEMVNKDIVTVVLHAINDSQNTIKNTDVKAQVLIGALTAMLINVKNFIHGSVLQAIFGGATILAIGFAFWVLIPVIKKQSSQGGGYFVSQNAMPSEMARDAIEKDWVAETYAVLINLASIRDHKVYKLYYAFFCGWCAIVSAVIDNVIFVLFK